MNQKRRAEIAKMIEEQQAVTNKELMDNFGISIETVRRDLNYLESQGVLTKVYGGAVKKEVVSFVLQNTKGLFPHTENKPVNN